MGDLLLADMRVLRLTQTLISLNTLPVQSYTTSNLFAITHRSLLLLSGAAKVIAPPDKGIARSIGTPNTYDVSPTL